MHDVPGLYLHLPFCRQKCHYCDFACYAGQEAKIDAYLDAVGAELAHYPAGLGVRTLYLGGGTPSVLRPDQFHRLVDLVEAHLRVAPDAERTMELNPGTGGPALWRALVERGFTRLSVGAQSFDDAMLARLGRDHTAADTRRTVCELREAGCTDLSLDLMYGLPGQTMADWEATLEEALACEPEHFSVYGLILEERTAFGAWQRQGRLELPSEELELAMGELLARRLAEAGYRRYEIASWARPGHPSRHNTLYWQLEPYLGLGAGAHSFYEGCRYANPRGLGAYMADPAGALTGRQPEPRAALEEESAFLALRMLEEGLQPERFRQAWGVELAARFPGVLPRLQELGLVEDAGDRYRLTPRGIWLSNEVFAAFLG